MKKQMYFETWLGIGHKYYIREMDCPVRVGTVTGYCQHTAREEYFNHLDTLKQANYIELHR